jgi:small subunit ribosomal protein S17
MAEVDQQKDQTATSESGAVGRSVTGTVISDKGDKTITVRVERLVKHAIYGKYIRRSSKVRAHDENNECNVGDLVTVRASRPYSKSKTFVLASIDERATGI